MDNIDRLIQRIIWAEATRECRASRVRRASERTTSRTARSCCTSRRVRAVTGCRWARPRQRQPQRPPPPPPTAPSRRSRGARRTTATTTTRWRSPLTATCPRLTTTRPSTPRRTRLVTRTRAPCQVSYSFLCLTLLRPFVTAGDRILLHVMREVMNDCTPSASDRASNRQSYRHGALYIENANKKARRGGDLMCDTTAGGRHIGP